MTQPGHFNSQLVHGPLFTGCATIQTGQPDIKTVAAVNLVNRQLAWNALTALGGLSLTKAEVLANLAAPMN